MSDLVRVPKSWDPQVKPGSFNFAIDDGHRGSEAQSSSVEGLPALFLKRFKVTCFFSAWGPAPSWEGKNCLGNMYEDVGGCNMILT